eukprot:1137658-Pelagomonas_calceolata.AAC.8
MKKTMKKKKKKKKKDKKKKKKKKKKKRRGRSVFNIEDGDQDRIRTAEACSPRAYAKSFADLDHLFQQHDGVQISCWKRYDCGSLIACKACGLIVDSLGEGITG